MKEKKKILLVIPPFFRLVESQNRRVSPAMHYLAQVLHNRGHDARLLNADHNEKNPNYADWESILENHWAIDERIQNGHESFDEVRAYLREFKPEFVVIMAGDILIPTTDFGSVKCAFKVLDIVEEECPEAITVAYGHQFIWSDRYDLNRFNGVIRGEGEEEISKIIEEGTRGYNGASWLSDMETLPMLNQEPLIRKIDPADFDFIMSMRGCSFSCTYCYQPVLRGKNVRMMSSQRFVDEVKYRFENGTKRLYFADMIFAPQPKRALEISRLLKEQVPGVEWHAEARVDTLKPEIAEAFKDAGCKHIKFGVEMMDERMLKEVHKGTNIAKIKKAFEIAKNAGLETTAYVLLGCNGFTDDDYVGMFSKFEDLKATNYVINVSVPSVGTKLYEQVQDKLKRAGLFLNGEEGYNHLADKMIAFWGISKDTLDMYFRLNKKGKKDDSHIRRYERRILERKQYADEKERKED